MHLSKILIIGFIIFLSTNLYSEDILLKLNQKDVDISGKLEKFFVLFPDPPADVKVSGPSKINIIVRKIIDKKNPLTKLPVNISVSIDQKKIKEITLNDREGSAVIKDATMFNAGSENIISIDVPEGEHSLQITTSRSAIKGLLIRVQKVSLEKTAVAQPPTVDKKEGKQDELTPPIIPPLLPLVPPQEKTAEVAPPPRSEIAKPSQEERKENQRSPVEKKESLVITEKVSKGDKTTSPVKEFGDIVVLSIKGGTVLPLQFGNPGGYGEFSTSFNVYKGFQIGLSIASYNTNRDYLINDPMTGNSILKYHLHAVPISASLGYKYQMKDILVRFELASGVNMIDIDLRREYASKQLDTINSFQMNLASDMSYITGFGSIGIGIKYLYSNADNFDQTNGFVKNINAGGLIISAGYNYGF